MSAPIRVSQNGDTDCFTVTPEEPLALPLDAQFSPPPAAAWARFLAAMMSLSVPASMASWLQSSLSTSMPLRTSVSAASAVSAASVSSSGAAAAGAMICAETASAEPKINAAASNGSLVQPNPVENSIVLPARPVRRGTCGRFVAKLWQKMTTSGPRGKRAPDGGLLHDGIRRGWRPGRRGSAAIGPELRGPLASPQPALLIFGR